MACVDIVRFLAKVHIGSNCHEWLGHKSNKLAYGRVCVGKQALFAHRVSYAKFVGPIPEGKVICHKCDNPSCVRPSHLFIGTQSINMKDAFNKQRIDHKGSKHPRARLSPKHVREIRERYTQGEMPLHLAQVYGMSRGAITGIIARKNWKYLE